MNIPNFISCLDSVDSAVPNMMSIKDVAIKLNLFFRSIVGIFIKNRPQLLIGVMVLFK